MRLFLCGRFLPCSVFSEQCVFCFIHIFSRCVCSVVFLRRGVNWAQNELRSIITTPPGRALLAVAPRDRTPRQPMAHAALPRRSAAPAPMGLAPLPRLVLPSQHPANAEQVIFFAAHGNLSATDTRLLAHYSLQLSQAKRVAMWVLIYRPEADGMDILPAESAAVGVPVAAWGDGTLRRGLPLVAAAIRKDAGLRATPNANHQRYFWFHCSLRLWELSFGHAAARPRFWWRAEMDVLFAGAWPWLLERALSSSADLLLPSLVRHDTPSGRTYPHWARNSAVLGASPPKDWVYGQVRQVQAVSWGSPGVLQRACATRGQWERLVAARSGFGLGKAPLLSPFATQACQCWPLLGALPRRAQRQMGRGVDGLRGDLAAHAVPAARPRAVPAGRLPPAQNQLMAQGHDGAIVVIVVIAVVRASSGSSSSRLAVVVLAVVVGNVRLDLEAQP